ncbi:MAG: hypothetical protein IH986_14595 [Planctomycetes bacterium]|nr:hypothetical protein [Planctomycetota bacterium]
MRIAQIGRPPPRRRASVKSFDFADFIFQFAEADTPNQPLTFDRQQQTALRRAVQVGKHIELLGQCSRIQPNLQARDVLPNQLASAGTVGCCTRLGDARTEAVLSGKVFSSVRARPRFHPIAVFL